ncbi:type IV secretory system conjugative DNA transfer family protein [Neisseriaceae bacterium ESL0693]|nr:type IV secretory system conjugative DNA transfer family protein [Neisseriaceae bacterium ESL0693]
MKKFATTLLFLLIACTILGVIGQFVGSLIMIQLAHLDLSPSLTLLYKVYKMGEHIPPKLVTPFKIGAGVALMLTFIPIPMVIVAALTKQKRQLHGSARFANRLEINQTGLLKKEFTSKDYPDLLLGKVGKQFLRWSSNTFLYLAAPTRSGKGVGIVIPNCLHYRGSLVVYDPKLENFLITAGFRRDKLKQQVFLFNPAGQMPEHAVNPNAPLVSHKWNPVTYIRRNYQYMYKDIMKMATILIPRSEKDSGSSTFFTESAQKLFTGLMLYMLETEKERDLADSKQKSTLANLFRLTAPVTGQTLAEWIKEEIELRDQQEHTQLSSNCKTLLYGFANGNAKTGADILATLTAPLGVFLDPVVEAATSGDDFLLTDLRKKRMTIYLGIIPTDSDPFARLTNLFFSQLVTVNIQQGLPENNPTLKYQCLLLMDEFTALGAIPAILHGVAYIAGYGLRLLIIIQSPSQVTQIYGKEATRTFFTNFSAHIVFTPQDDTDAKEYSEMIGYETFKARSVSRSSGRTSSNSRSDSDQRRAVMLPQELRLMPQSDSIISLNNTRPIYAKKIMYWQDEIFIKRANLPFPIVPALTISDGKRRISTKTQIAQYISAEEMPGTDFRDCTNAGEIATKLLAQLITPDSSKEYIEQLSYFVNQNLGIESMPILKSLLAN